MKLIVQIPCYNEEQTLLAVLESIPKKIKGVDSLEILIIDDGSTDKTVAVAKKFGIRHIIYHRRNMGLARSFQDGVNLALELGADILVNTDGDNQYPQAKIPDLIQPILAGQAEIVVADRQTAKIADFSPLKKCLQLFGSYIVNKAAGTNLPDAASGFRAYSRLSLLRLNTITQFSYCMETIIQAGNKRLAIVSIPITANPKTRPSRLFKNMWQHVFKSMTAIVRAYIMYKPRVIFSSLSTFFLVIGLVPFVRYLVFAVEHDADGHLQSLLVGAVFLFIAFLLMVLGIVADLIHINRILLEEMLERTKINQLNK
ncbi:MAG: glycosyltransferase family 2 protein [Candidatus Saccharimonadales bacterium]